MTASTRATLRAAIGPGLLMAGAAVGVSHLVQATRGGAEYGLLLIPIVLLACLFKYPFLEFGPRYAAATGHNLLTGYHRLGNWALGLYIAVTLGTLFIIQAVVTLTTAGLFALVFGLDLSMVVLSALILAACIAFLMVEAYKGLDLGMKIIMAALSVSTVVAVALAFQEAPDWHALSGAREWSNLWTLAGLAFVLALLGWMPIPLDVAAWHSVWTQERARMTGHHPSVREAVFDFRLGFFGATALALVFMLLGALLMYGSGVGFAPGAAAFSAQLVDLYAQSLGEWSRSLIAIAALTTMFSTTLAVTDAYPRVIMATLRALRENSHQPRSSDPDTGAEGRLEWWGYRIALLIVATGALALIWLAGEQFTRFVDIATTLSFLSAPILAWITFRAVMSPDMPADARPGPGLRALAWAGIIFLAGFSLAWLVWRFVL
ncbi:MULTISPECIES: NRAMP family divalent metal transporter [unclassified Thioalkalivibrio]|uniref:NRAMP family divalent metal transporter n=1 Tax=unclassified Thioalkalivibrio TaxID=2621013 RepID=UPI00036AC9A9|nr:MULTISPECIES: divalent metal cation transporter [unclassified Thioalkalivibrio]